MLTVMHKLVTIKVQVVQVKVQVEVTYSLNATRYHGY